MNTSFDFGALDESKDSNCNLVYGTYTSSLSSTPKEIGSVLRLKDLEWVHFIPYHTKKSVVQLMELENIGCIVGEIPSSNKLTIKDSTLTNSTLGHCTRDIHLDGVGLNVDLPHTMTLPSYSNVTIINNKFPKALLLEIGKKL